MFLPHIKPSEPVASVPACSPVPIVISRQISPRIDRGSALQVRHCETWFDYSYHENAETAVIAFEYLPSHGITDPDRWRVLCHELDLGTLESVAVRQPKQDWE